MNMGRAFGAVALVCLGTLGCTLKTATMPTKKVPAGLVLMEFVNQRGSLGSRWRRTVAGPVDIAIDGVRIPVQQDPKGGSALEIRGLAVGKHRYFLSSPQDAFGMDQGEFEVVAGSGTYVLLFNQKFNAVLYGQIEPLPKAEGLPGVTARLLK